MYFNFRVNANEVIGVGHLMRCITLAKKLEERKHQTTFLVRKIPPSYAKILSENNISYVDIEDYSLEMSNELSDVDIDIKKTEKAIGKKYIDWLIVDSYDLGVEWERKIRNRVNRILAIDDIARSHECDLLLDQNFPENHEYKIHDLVPMNCKVMLGPKYALLKDEFSLNKKNEDNISTHDEALIFVGGGSNENYIKLILNAFENEALKNINLNLIVGPEVSLEKISSIKLSRNGRLKINKFQPGMAKFMKEADFFVGGCGSTSWERMCVGIPSIAITVAKNQEYVAQKLHNLGYLIYAGDGNKIKSQDLVIHILDLIKNQESTRKMIKLGKSLVDGFGVHRVIELIESFSEK